MAVAPFTTPNILGHFEEKSAGHYFEWSENDEPFAECPSRWPWEFPHKIWVGDEIGSPYRLGIVKKTVAYICIDEDEFGHPVLEKWSLKNTRIYPNPISRPTNYC